MEDGGIQLNTGKLTTGELTAMFDFACGEQQPHINISGLEGESPYHLGHQFNWKFK